jgi:hypothetical protein
MKGQPLKISGISNKQIIGVSKDAKNFGISTSRHKKSIEKDTIWEDVPQTVITGVKLYNSICKRTKKAL